jgi:methyl-accepting chemotaxis protein
VLFWKIPKYLIFAKDWRVPFALLSMSLRFFQSFRIHASIFIIWLVGIVLGLTAENKFLLGTSICFLTVTTTVTFISRIGAALQSDRLHDKAKTIIQKAATFIKGKQSVVARAGPVTHDLNDKDLEQWRSDLEFSMLFNRAALYFARQFKDYQNSGTTAFSAVLTILRMSIGIIFTFAVANYALFHLDQMQFAFSREPNFFGFFYYSFNNFFLNSIDGLTASGQLAQAFAMLQNFLGFVLVAIFVSLLFSIKTQRATQDIQSLIQLLEDQAVDMNDFIQGSFRVSSMQGIVDEINKMQNSLTKILLQLTGRRWN